jgi:phosphatidylglycerophosphatase C
VALFDLDRTVTRRDTLWPYVYGFLRRQPARAPRLVRVLPALLRLASRRADRGELKAALIRAALGGLPRETLDAWTAHFVPQLVARGVRTDALDEIGRHRANGDRLVLLSASVDLYVPAIGIALGFDEVLCTEVRWSGGRLDGALASPNRRGVEKARCLAQLRARHPGLAIVAYGDSRSDLAHLALADRGVLVNGAVRTRRAAARLGFQCVRWR